LGDAADFSVSAIRCVAIDLKYFISPFVKRPLIPQHAHFLDGIPNRASIRLFAVRHLHIDSLPLPPCRPSDWACSAHNRDRSGSQALRRLPPTARANHKEGRHGAGTGAGDATVNRPSGFYCLDTYPGASRPRDRRNGLTERNNCVLVDRVRSTIPAGRHTTRRPARQGPGVAANTGGTEQGVALLKKGPRSRGLTPLRYSRSASDELSVRLILGACLRVRSGRANTNEHDCVDRHEAQNTGREHRHGRQ
jgi:hypothetical protein